MAVRALLMTTVILLDGQKQPADAVSLSVAPNRLQFLEYESVTFYCEGVVYCEVGHKEKLKSCCKTNTTQTGSPCTIKNVYKEDSGEYWCETEGGKRSNIINISVADGSVILEVPALPVMEGQTVTLHCRNKTSSSNLTAHFYKDGRHIHRSSTGNMNIYRVSKSDEGLYKCSISGAGESPESWLNLTDQQLASQNVNSTTNPDVHTEESRSPSAATRWIIATVLLSALLVAALGLFHFAKGSCNRALLCQSAKVDHSDSAEDEKVYIETGPVTAGGAVYAAVRKNKTKDDEQMYYSLDQDDAQRQESGTIRDPSSAGLQQPAADDCFYSLVQ